MASALQVRNDVQDALARRVPAALTPVTRAVRPVWPTGVAMVDALLEGGLPAGAISELTGGLCAGRVTLATAFTAGMTRAGQVCAWVDAGDGFDPESAEASGMDLQRLLWVRCGDKGEAVPVAVGGGAAGTQYGVTRTRETGTVCGGPHPRTEEQGLAEAIGGLLGGAGRGRGANTGKAGTPSAQNRALTGDRKTAKRKVQVASDRVPARRGEHALEQKAKLNAGESGVVEAVSARASLGEMAAGLAVVAPRCAETQQGFARATQARVLAMPVRVGVANKAVKQDRKPWDRLGQAVRATDLLLQGGGFGCIVMDLSGVTAECAHRIPLATWFRFRAAADRARTSLLVLTRHPCTQSSGEVLLRLSAEVPEDKAVMSGLGMRVEVVRQRFLGALPSHVVSIRKPPRRATEGVWAAPAVAARAVALAGGGQ